MNNEGTFRPPRRRGLIFQIGAALAFLSAGGLLFYLSMEQQVGLYFILLLLASLLLLSPVPLIIYRAIALSRATYKLEREGLRLRWGLRAEDIPFQSIEWIRPAAELGYNLTLPRFSWPGALLGFTSIHELGIVEFIAADSENLILIATPSRILAISPANLKAFMLSFQRTSELGSLTPMAAYSLQPAVFARNVWKDMAARVPILTTILLTVALLVGVIVIMPTRRQVSIGFESGGIPLPPVPSERLLLLPILAGLTGAISILIGLMYYRYDDRRIAAYLILTGAAATPFLLLLSLVFMR